MIFFRLEFPLYLNLNSFIPYDENSLDNESVISEGYLGDLLGPGRKCDDSNYIGTDHSYALDEIDQVFLKKNKI